MVKLQGNWLDYLWSWDDFVTSTALLGVIIFVYLFNNVLTGIASACLEGDLLSINSKH